MVGMMGRRSSDYLFVVIRSRVRIPDHFPFSSPLWNRDFRIFISIFVVTGRFLPRDAMHKRALCRHAVSVCVSVSHVRGCSNISTLIEVCFYRALIADDRDAMTATTYRPTSRSDGRWKTCSSRSARSAATRRRQRQQWTEPSFPSCVAISNCSISTLRPLTSTSSSLRSKPKPSKPHTICIS